MIAIKKTERRSKLDTQVCEYCDSLDGMNKRFTEYVRTTRFSLVQTFTGASFIGINLGVSL